jgi:hypothetical protein
MAVVLKSPKLIQKKTHTSTKVVLRLLSLERSVARVAGDLRPELQHTAVRNWALTEKQRAPKRLLWAQRESVRKGERERETENSVELK